MANHALASACLVLHATATGAGVHLFTSSLPPAVAKASPLQAQPLAQRLQLWSPGKPRRPPGSRAASGFPPKSTPPSATRAFPHPRRRLGCAARQPDLPRRRRRDRAARNSAASQARLDLRPQLPAAHYRRPRLRSPRRGAQTGSSSHDSPLPTHPLQGPAPRFGGDGGRPDPSARTRRRPHRRTPGDAETARFSPLKTPLPRKRSPSS